jgi:hypothetical protein
MRYKYHDLKGFVPGDEFVEGGEVVNYAEMVQFQWSFGKYLVHYHR